MRQVTNGVQVEFLNLTSTFQQVLGTDPDRLAITFPVCTNGYQGTFRWDVIFGQVGPNGEGFAVNSSTAPVTISFDQVGALITQQVLMRTDGTSVAQPVSGVLLIGRA